MSHPSKRTLWLAVAVLLIGAAAIISCADDLSLWIDETWSVFHATGSLDQVLHERDVTWPPGYYLTLHLWSKLASWNDFTLHCLGAFFGILTAALLIAIGRRLHLGRAGLLAALAFATSSYARYFTLEIRGYGLLILTTAVFIYAYLRWLARPTWGRSAALLAAQVAMLYTHFIAAAILALAGAHLVGHLALVARRSDRSAGAALRLWLVVTALTGTAFLPLLPQFVRGFGLRSRADGSLPWYFLGEFGQFVRAYSAHWDALFALIALLAAAGLVALVLRPAPKPPPPRIASLRLTLLWLALWGVGIPTAAYFLRASLPIFTSRYLSFTMLPVFLLIGIGLAALPTRYGPQIGTLALLALAAAPWQPFDHRPNYSDNAPPLHDFTRMLARRFQPGDTLVIDTNCGCQLDEIAWWYYESLYFPLGRIPRAASSAETGRRVWYVVRQGSEDTALAESVRAGRVMREFWGPWYFAVTLYEAPPNGTGTLIGDAVRFHGADVARRPLLHAGERISAALWWSADRTPPADYSISLQVVDALGRVVAQADGAPDTAGTPPQLSAWQPGQLYRDERTLHLPYQLESGFYTFQVIVYQWWDGVRLQPAPIQIDRARLVSHAVW